jgi:hypothetical protein
MAKFTNYTYCCPSLLCPYIDMDMWTFRHIVVRTLLPWCMIWLYTLFWKFLLGMFKIKNIGNLLVFFDVFSLSTFCHIGHFVLICFVSVVILSVYILSHYTLCLFWHFVRIRFVTLYVVSLYLLSLYVLFLYILSLNQKNQLFCADRKNVIWGFLTCLTSD